MDCMFHLSGVNMEEKKHNIVYKITNTVNRISQLGKNTGKKYSKEINLKKGRKWNLERKIKRQQEMQYEWNKRRICSNFEFFYYIILGDFL